MAAAPFLAYPDLRFGQRAEPRPVDGGLRSIGARLLAAAAEARAYGLAAVHIGEVAPVIVVSVASPDRRDYRLFYNPRVAAVSNDIESGTEGSVSLPGVQVEIGRPRWVELVYADEAGVPRSERFDGFVARCILHETEQVNGIFFLDHLSRLKRQTLLRKANKARRPG